MKSLIAFLILCSLAHAQTANVCPLAPLTGPGLPMNQASPPYTYPTQYQGYLNDSGGGGGLGTAVLDTSTSANGLFNAPCVSVTILADSNTADVSNTGYFDYSPLFPGASAEWGFARQFTANPTAWPINKINRMSFWFYGNRPFEPNGNLNTDVGTYVYSVSAGVCPQQGAHYYHSLNLPPDVWCHCVLNMHPNHFVGAPGNVDPGDQPYPCDSGTNYMDSLKRFYVTQPYVATAGLTYKMSQPVFYTQTATEPDNDIYSLAASVSGGTVTLTWDINKNDSNLGISVYHSYSDMHVSGLTNAVLDWSGSVSSNGGYNGQVLAVTKADLSGSLGSTLYFAVVQQSTGLFSEVDLPLGVKPPPAPPVGTIQADVNLLARLHAATIAAQAAYVAAQQAENSQYGTVLQDAQPAAMQSTAPKRRQRR